MKQLVSLLVVAALIAGGVVAAQAYGGDPEPYRVTADVAQAPNLFEGGRVMVRGVDVGSIADVEPRPDGVRLHLEIEDGVPVPADATLSVIPITVISDRYVQLFPAYISGPRMADGDHIPMDRTSIPAELDEVLTQLHGLLSALEPRPGEKTGPLAKLVTELDAALAGRGEKLRGTLTGSAAVLENLADSEFEIIELIRNLDTTFIALAERSSEIGLLNERFQLVAESLLADQGNLEGTIENLAFLSDQTAGLFEESGDDLGGSFVRLERVLKAILAQQDELTAGIKWSNVIAEALGETDASGKGTHAYTGRQAAPGTPGAEYNYRIDTRDIVGCRRIEVFIDGIVRTNPGATYDELVEAVLDFIPLVYRDHIRYLVRLLLGPCADVFPPGITAAQKRRANAVIAVLVSQVGAEELDRLTSTWFARGRRSRS